MFAVIKTGGKQYRVSVGSRIKIERLKNAPKQAGKVSFDEVLIRGNGSDIEIGAPYLKGVHVEGKFLGEKRDEKKIIFRYHNKTRYRKKKGHRQTMALVEITKV